MDRYRFAALWSAAAWGLLIFSWISQEFTFYGVDPFFVVLFMWIFRGPIVNRIYGSPQPRNIQAIAPLRAELPLCPSCGNEGMRSDRFCQDCGTALEHPNTQYEGFN
ncbi:MAG: hypothetical protein ACXAE3_04210 [Candidatus Kariarchaeaceae archaeon]|jgi:hypothetical protein